MPSSVFEPVTAPPSVASAPPMPGPVVSAKEERVSSSSGPRSYGPVRHIGCLGSSRGNDLFRPPAVLQEDLGEVLEELTKHGVKRSHGPKVRNHRNTRALGTMKLWWWKP